MTLNDLEWPLYVTFSQLRTVTYLSQSLFVEYYLLYDVTSRDGSGP